MDRTLAENLKRKIAEEIEFNEIDTILPSLLEQNLITDIECRMIAGYEQLLGKQAAVHKVIMSKTKEEAAHLTEIFRTSTVFVERLLSKMPKTSDFKDEDENNLPQEKPNPLMIKTVLSCIFTYLPLKDIKHSRLVCREWNSVTEIFLRKRCKIHFRPDGLTPQSFMVVSKYSLPDLPFPAYKFSGVDYARCLEVIDHFFYKWGKNIKEVELAALNTSHDRIFGIYDINSWIEKTSKLCSLKISCADQYKSTLFSISIDKLATIKTIILENCRILTNGERASFLLSSNVRLINVSFQRLGNVEIRQECFCYNEFFDFSQVANLAIINDHHDEVKFDMAGQINKNQLYLQCVDLQNLYQAKGDINLLRLSWCEFYEINDLKITRMIIDNSVLDLCVLPETLEKLRFGGNMDIIHRESFELPNLKYLSFEAESENSGLLAFLLANLPNLTELELWDNDEESGLILDLDCIPRNVKKLGIKAGLKIEFANGDQVLEIGTLVLESIEHCKQVLGRIKPKVLVMSYYESRRMPLNPSDILEIILANKQIGTILFGASQWVVDLHKKFPFEESTFSSYVDKKSTCYKFENQVGRAIERKEFQDFNDVADIGDDYFE